MIETGEYFFPLPDCPCLYPGSILIELAEIHRIIGRKSFYTKEAIMNTRAANVVLVSAIVVLFLGVAFVATAADVSGILEINK
jgi:hypothetical protein